MYICIYIYVFMCVYIYICMYKVCMYIYIEREREREISLQNYKYHYLRYALGMLKEDDTRNTLVNNHSKPGSYSDIWAGTAILCAMGI